MVKGWFQSHILLSNCGRLELHIKFYIVSVRSYSVNSSFLLLQYSLLHFFKCPILSRAEQSRVGVNRRNEFELKDTLASY